jgi:hypothetical protein
MKAGSLFCQKSLGLGKLGIESGGQMCYNERSVPFDVAVSRPCWQALQSQRISAKSLVSQLANFRAKGRFNGGYP